MPPIYDAVVTATTPPVMTAIPMICGRMVFLVIQCPKLPGYSFANTSEYRKIKDGSTDATVATRETGPNLMAAKYMIKPTVTRACVSRTIRVNP